MSKHLHIGTADGKAFNLPIDAATQTFAFIARKGAGKTYAAGKLTELLIDAGVQVVVFDTVGNWWGLRLDATGKGDGIDEPVLGGLRGDIPLQPTAGALIADIAVDTGRSLVLDASQFNKSDRQRFATAFAERLWTRKKGERHPSPLHLVIEESQLIIPEAVRGDNATMVGIYEEIIRLGRNYGIGVTMISQRPQSVNKEVLNQTECLFVLQVNGAHERKALKEWIVHQGMDPKLLEELPSLPIGTAYVWSPQWLGILEKVKIGQKRTFDASATPKVGSNQVRRDIKPLDLTELQQRMADTIEKAKADDPTLLRAEVARLKAELNKSASKAHGAKPVTLGLDPKAVQAALEKAIADRDRQWTRRVSQMQRAGESLIERLEKINRISLLNGEVGVLRRDNPIEPMVSPPPAPINRITRDMAKVVLNTTPKPPPRIRSESTGDQSALPIGERKVLTACAQYPDGLKREQLTVLTGYKRSSRDTYIQRLRERGYVEADGEKIRATDDGVSALGDFDPLPEGDELREYWLNRLPQGEKAILQVLIDAYPEAVDRDALSEATGYLRSSRDTYIQRMRAKQVIEIVGRGAVKASDNLFEGVHT